MTERRCANPLCFRAARYGHHCSDCYLQILKAFVPVLVQRARGIRRRNQTRFTKGLE